MGGRGFARETQAAAKMGASTAGERGGREPAGAMSAIGEVAKQLQSNYRQTTPKRLRMLDMFLVFVFATGVLQVREGGGGDRSAGGHCPEVHEAEYRKVRRFGQARAQEGKRGQFPVSLGSRFPSGQLHPCSNYRCSICWDPPTVLCL